VNYPVLIGIAVVLFALRFARLNMLLWLIAWWVAVWVAVRFGVEPPMPASIVGMFMGIVTVGLIAYASSDADRLRNATTPIVRFIVDQRYKIPLVVVVLALPMLVGLKVYNDSKKSISAPVFGRTIHPAPPSTTNFKGKQVDLIAGHNPYRELEAGDPDAFAQHLANGRRVYYENCVFCHGDDMHGDGIFAHALDPIPANFAEPTTIAMLQETYLFWRIAKGAPGLPEEATPWASAMPAWENFLTEEEIWDVILFLYDHTGSRPRAREEHE
jgi:mono/diheme cytochrome c family protein